MNSNFRIIGILVLILVTSLLFWNAELRYYKEHSLKANVLVLVNGWNDSTQYIERALDQLEKGNISSTVNWLVAAETALEKTLAVSSGYNVALNNRFLNNGNHSLGLNQALSIYTQEIRSIRQQLVFSYEIKRGYKQLLKDIATDLKTIKAAFPEKLLMDTDKQEILDTLFGLEKLLKVEFVKSHI